MIRLVDISKVYGESGQQTTALSHVSCEFPDKGFVCINGESGCGKTTLLNILSGFARPTSGRLIINGNSTENYSDAEWDEYHSSTIGFVFQNYNVLEELTVYDNVGMALNVFDLNSNEKTILIQKALTKTGISHKSNEKTACLSGGEKQRAAIARAYVKLPQIILADEPTGNLDTENSRAIFRLFKELADNTLIIVVTHDKELAAEYADRIITLKDGRLISDKKNSKNSFSYIIKNTEDNTEYVNDDFMLIKEYVDNAFLKNKNNTYVLCLEEKVKSRQQSEEDFSAPIEGNKICRRKYKRQRMSAGNIMHTANRILSKRRIREAVTAVVFSITLFLLIISILLITYDKDAVVTEYLEQYNDKYLYVQKEIKKTGYSGEESSLISVSEDIYSELKAISPEEFVCRQLTAANLSTYSSEVEFLKKKENTDVGKDCSVNVNIVSKKTLDGLGYGAETSNGILITDYVAERLNISEGDIGNEIYLNDSKVIISGIVATDFRECANKTSLEKYYNDAFMSEEYTEWLFEYYSENFINLQGNNFFEDSLFGYINNALRFAGTEGEAFEIIAGRMPEKKNEILISEETAFKYDFGVENLVSNKIELKVKDLQSQNYSEDLSRFINLYNYLGDNVVVVGVASMEADVMLTSEVYNHICKTYCDIYYFNSLGIYSEDREHTVKQLHDMEYQLADESLSDVYLLSGLKIKALGYIAALLFIMIILTILLFISFISYNVKDNARLIGVLRSMGITWKDVKRILMAEPLMIIMFSVIFAAVGSLLTVCIVNHAFMSSFMMRAYKIIVLEWQGYLLTAISIFITGLLSVWLPVIMMDKKEIIQLIQE